MFQERVWGALSASAAARCASLRLVHKDGTIMQHQGPQTLGPENIVHWSAVLSFALSIFVVLVSALWWQGWLPWAPRWLNGLLSITLLFGPFVTVILATASIFFALYEVWRSGGRASLFLAISALLLALLALKWLFDHWAAN